MPAQTVFSWNALVGSYLSSGSAGEAVRVYRAMRASAAPGSVPDGCTLASVFKACGHEVHGLAVRSELDKSTLVANALIGMYTKCGMLDSALRVFECLEEERDVASWNSVITGCRVHAESEDTGSPGAVLRDAELWIRYEFLHEASLCGASSAESGKGVTSSTSQMRQWSNIQFNALLVMYAKCGWVDSALRVVHQIDEKDCISWNSMLSCSPATSKTGLYAEVIKFFFFGEMLQYGSQLDHACVISLSSALGHLGWLNNGREVHVHKM
jgi:pentatricopeptide repeat protein